MGAMVSTAKTTTQIWKRFGSRQNIGLLYILPSVLFVSVFFIIPLGMTLWMSLHDWPLMGSRSFIGTDNYTKLVSDEQFWASLWFTTKYTLMVTPPIFILAFVLALLIKLLGVAT